MTLVDLSAGKELGISGAILYLALGIPPKVHASTLNMPTRVLMPPNIST
jgi:hypothetical protein